MPPSKTTWTTPFYGARLHAAIYTYWGEELHVHPDLFLVPGTTVRMEEDWRGSRRLSLRRLGAHSVVRCDPDVQKMLNGLLASLPPARAMTVDDALQFYGPDRLTHVIGGQDHFMTPDNLNLRPTPSGFTLRFLDLANATDNAALATFIGTATAEELDDADILPDEPDPVIVGAFDGPTMVAYASHRYWGREQLLSDIGVLVQSPYRRAGLGHATVAALTAWGLAQHKIPMYRHVNENKASRKLALAVGFAHTCTIDVLEFVADA